jgi:hypothetical protein
MMVARARAGVARIESSPLNAKQGLLPLVGGGSDWQMSGVKPSILSLFEQAGFD